MTEIRKLADNFPEAPAYRDVLATLDWDNLDKPNDDTFIDETATGFEALKDPNTNVRSWLTRWSALVHDRLKSSSGSVPVGEDPSMTAQGVFKYLLYGAEVAGVDLEMATLAGLGSAKTHEDRVVFVLKRREAADKKNERHVEDVPTERQKSGLTWI
ncbi:hypothetical protein Pmar_PMAR022536 [Perkinsus marinus ATCC 50983]|uniref:Uncharacterized protein n=1 Tax=Perkinsus marinus (strain ATCC 50983 / TXsc) TaxID=423536 RepID=C5KNI8_PERM5|nr:hypothetical protein Pmar_PMAR022536 [Perkinsus marinus ATCC 50983]EER14003.1 hypothetical protein Pmar_PMAR022536 [Perkinsus marinus ATCC 50983]|eukprot:XP_002782208.1 hypothetical protein Pmar_PMAR022536 [Perkinsus marinus ATCC 50983]